MFSKTADATAAPNSSTSARPRAPGNAALSILANDLKITGEISSTGAVEVYGEIDGNIAAETLTIGTEGRVTGALHARTVEVKGQVEGKITCDSFTMRATAQVSADVSYAKVVIESGALIDGRFAKVGG
ncbi:polymer-forming cytoskeletal protein [Xinfangfangia sp. CPCC 101601]|uniref:Polymer-forming cytoskeletal protein n=1 Tax=Pseudogemmobacter lacusdianii TaxID=3069608 RepID=A0ABU0W311_9RHOB|nr:polymer-forming cytoskeletal protein [Xinfangfangia sp. CPCC 101601]MDQ2068173.1 polymer-forming cytoskeletal protein [Xinfangfangia sp. CPCC 101601]